MPMTTWKWQRDWSEIALDLLTITVSITVDFFFSFFSFSFMEPFKLHHSGCGTSFCYSASPLPSPICAYILTSPSSYRASYWPTLLVWLTKSIDKTVHARVRNCVEYRTLTALFTAYWTYNVIITKCTVYTSLIIKNVYQCDHIVSGQLHTVHVSLCIIPLFTIHVSYT